MSKKFLFSWDPDCKDCIRVSDKELTLELVRASVGFEVDRETGSRTYLVPKKFTTDSGDVKLVQVQK